MQLDKNQKSKLKLKSNTIGLILLIPVILLLTLFTFLPIILSFIESFKVYARHSMVNYTFGIRNFTQLVSDSEFKDSFLNTNLLIFLGTPLVIFLAFILSLIFSEISSKIFKNIAVVCLFSQFFTSAFAVGISFIYFFSTNNDGFNRLFNTRIRFTNDFDGRNILIVYFIYYVWRLLPFNVVMMSFSFSSSLEKYSRVIKIDQLKFGHKVRYVYLKNFNTVFWLVLYVNFANAGLFYPGAIVDSNLRLTKGNTLASYLYDHINPNENSSAQLNYALAAAANIVIIAYLSLLSISFLIIKKTNFKQLFIKLKKKVKNHENS
ncbi:sugar ABC transporter permease [Mycoplasmoides gallisepticum]|uniref:sugar ABC transporter permease n=1 Tax=Mycoplasmoides gallisepticum TaxID=2096 RepID=UPI0001C39946|nr:sugar ABC transporter permease [Mycoplasmoides gallisepticum]ADC31518.1 ABC-type sugar transport system permease protein [Mycoplasmoides gallisepticum str. F]AFP75866.1 ABC-type sugar transport system permease protein [Mycoplasmoides gallisepticum VA94_7994-1-7P]AFP76633.1 ABC-type sugar transport system permease protein [Mycoplasmoides gallisepticum NC95_13295-2-2P]AFP77387.1 ABC-type sugar transport system permease protein [Mycoplasmoides gallisepticum NC96_1596-4-2P]AFP78158.1 ABC-type s